MTRFMEEGGAAVLSLTPAPELREVLRRMRDAARLLLLLDYDGTLVPYASLPELAAPDAALLELLGALAGRPRTTVHVVSGRPRDSVERWLGALPIGLHAEHGFWSRDAAGEPWRPLAAPIADWRPRVQAVLEELTGRTPGSLIEQKTASLAWHYRLVDPELAARRLDELQRRLDELLRSAPIDTLAGEKVIEVRSSGISKGGVVGRLTAAMAAGTTAAAFGDDLTDEELFAALPDGGIAIHVGPRPSRAPIRIAAVEDARRLLGALL